MTLMVVVSLGQIWAIAVPVLQKTSAEVVTEFGGSLGPLGRSEIGDVSELRVSST